MAFEYSRTGDFAQDQGLGLRIEHDPKFWDTSQVNLRLTNLRTAQSWLLPVEAVTREITYETPAGARTDRVSVAGKLMPVYSRALIDGLMAARGKAGQPMAEAEVVQAVTAAVRTFFLRGDIMLKWIPDFTVTWD
jgi:hypothetical protein